MASTTNHNPEFTGPVRVAAETAVTAGGVTGIGLLVGNTTNFGIFFGSGTPQDKISAAKGSLYLNSTGSSTSTRLYVNTGGTYTWTSVTAGA